MPDGIRVYLTDRLTTRAVGPKAAVAEAIEYRFSEDAASRVSCAEEKDLMHSSAIFLPLLRFAPSHGRHRNA